MRFLDEIAEEVAAERRGAAMAPARRNGGGFLDEIAEEVRRERAVEAAPAPPVLPAPDQPNILTRIATPIARTATGLARSAYDVIAERFPGVPTGEVLPTFQAAETATATPRRGSGVTGTWEPEATALEAGASPSELVSAIPPVALPGPPVQPGAAAAVAPPPAIAPVMSQVEVRRQAPGAAVEGVAAPRIPWPDGIGEPIKAPLIPWNATDAEYERHVARNRVPTPEETAAAERALVPPPPAPRTLQDVVDLEAVAPLPPELMPGKTRRREEVLSAAGEALGAEPTASVVGKMAPADVPRALVFENYILTPGAPVQSAAQRQAERRKARLRGEIPSTFAESAGDVVIDAFKTSAVGAGIASGLYSTAAGMMSVVPWVEQLAGVKTGLGDVFKDAAVRIGDVAERLTPDDPGWLHTIAAGFGSSMGFFVPGMGLGKALQLIRAASPRLALWVGSGTAAIMEAGTEAGAMYQDALNLGLSEQQATSRANHVFWQNLIVLAATNKAGIFSESGGLLRRTAKGIGAEAFQEATQEVIGERQKMSVTENPYAAKDVFSPERLKQYGTAAVVGGAVGGVLGGGRAWLGRRTITEAKKAAGEDQFAALVAEAERQGLKGGAAELAVAQMVLDVSEERAATPAVAPAGLSPAPRGQIPAEIQESGRQAARKALERERPQFVPAPETAGVPEPAPLAPPTPPTPAPTPTFRAGDRVRNIQTDALGTVSTAGDMTFWVRWDKGGPMDGQTTIMERSKAAGTLEMAPAAGTAAPAPPVEPAPPAAAPPVAPEPPEAAPEPKAAPPVAPAPEGLAEGEEEAPKAPVAPKGEVPAPAPPIAKPLAGTTEDPPSAVWGRPTRAETPAGSELSGRWGLAELDELVVSHSPTGGENEAYPQELQRRDRSRVASQDQVLGIANALSPLRLGESALGLHGAPWVAGRVVVGGNGRVNALRLVYGGATENLAKRRDAYRAWLADSAEQFGFTRAQVETMRRPVLHQQMQNIGPADLSRVAEELNESGIARMSPTEQAMTDAGRLTPELLSLWAPNEAANPATTENADFRRAFLEHVVGAADRGGFITAKGEPNPAFVQRMRHAIFAKAYGERAVERVADALDDNTRNISAALMNAAPRFVSLRAAAERGDLYPLDPSPDLAEAADTMSYLRDQGMSVETYLNQGDIFNTPLGREFLLFFDRNARSAKRMANILAKYADAWERAGHPQQGGLFGDTIPTAGEVLDAILAAEEGRDVTGPAAQLPTLRQNQARGGGGSAPPPGGKEGAPAAGAPGPAGGVAPAPPAPPAVSADAKQAAIDRARGRLGRPTPPPRGVAETTRTYAVNDPARDADLLVDLFIVGQAEYEAGATDRAAWTERMRGDLGDEAQPHLDYLWELIDAGRELRQEVSREEPTPEAVAGGTSGEVRPGGPGGVPDLRGAGRGAAGERRLILARPEQTHRVEIERTPAAVRSALTDEQRQGAEKVIRALEDQGAFLLADGTGAGKTRQILAAASYFAGQGHPVIVIAPASVLKLQTTKGQRRVSGSYADDGAAMRVPVSVWWDGPIAPGRIYVTTYEKSKALPQVEDAVLVFDEAHALKNADSARAMAGIRMATRARAVLFATATPVDRPLHLEYLIGSGLFGDRSPADVYQGLGLRQRSITVRTKSGASFQKMIWEIDPRVGEETVYRRMRELFDGLTERSGMIKREVDMAAMGVTFLPIPLPASARATAQRIADGLSRGAAVEGLLKARILMHQRRQQEPYKIPLAALAAKRELDEGRQVVLFVSRVNYSEAVLRQKIVGFSGEVVDEIKHILAASEGTAGTLRRAVEALGITDIAELHGEAEEKASEAMEAFQSGRARVLIATPESGGIGINLDDRTGDRPRTVIMITAPFTATDTVQALGRVNRMTTKSDVRSIFLYSDLPLDAWNLGIVAMKLKALRATVRGGVEQIRPEDTTGVSERRRGRYTAGRGPSQQALPGAETEVGRRGEAAQLPLGEAQAEPRTSGETPGETFRRIEAENRARARELDAKPVGTIMTVPGGQALGSLVGTWERVNVAGDPFWRQIEGIHKGDHKPSAMFAPHLSHQDIRITEPLRTERTTFGDQGLIPGTPGRAIPTGKITPEEPQRPIEETPLFGQKEEERRRESDEAQGRLFAPVRTSGTTGIAISERGGRVLAGSMYGGQVPAIAVKEGVQNSIDAIRTLPNPSKGVIRVDFDSRANKLTIEDNGAGMSKDVATTELMEIGESDKPAEGSSGAFGLAKAVLFGHAKTLDIVTRSATTEESERQPSLFGKLMGRAPREAAGPRRIVETRLTGTGSDWLNRSLPWTSDDDAPSGPTGTKVTVEFEDEVPKGDAYAVRNWIREFLETVRFPARYEFTVDGEVFSTKDVAAKVRHVETLTVPGASVDVLVSDDTVDTRYPTIRVLNNGIPQFQIASSLRREMPMPRLIVADVHASVPATSLEYPFASNRETLKGAAQRAINEYVNTKLAVDAAMAERQRFTKLLDAAPALGKSNLKLVDGTGIIDKAFVKELAAAPSARQVAEAVGRVFTRLQAALASGDPRFARAEYTGAILHGDWLGINLLGEAFHGPGGNNLVFFNPFLLAQSIQNEVAAGGFSAAQAPRRFAQSAAHVMLHELTHQGARSEDADFTAAFRQNDGNTFDLRVQLANELAAYMEEGGGFRYRATAKFAEDLALRYGGGRGVFGQIGAHALAPRGERDADVAGAGAGRGPGPEVSLRPERGAAADREPADLGRGEAVGVAEPTTPYSAVPGRPELVGPAETFKHGDREPADEAFYYHITTAAAARRIIREGFVPGRRQTMAEGAYRDLARGKVFLTDRQGVGYWRDRIEEHLEHQYDNPPKLVVVRVSRDAVSVESDPNRAWNEPASWVIAGEPRRVEESISTPYSALPPDEALIRRAERHYGVTEDWHEAGYVLPDGTMLDFSGRHYSAGYERKPGAIQSAPVRGQPDYLGGRRNVDHREDLSVVMPEFEPGTASAPEGRRMRTFMDRTGAVRFHPSVPGLDFGVVPPTDAQLRVAIRAARETRKPLVIDGPERQSWTFDRPTLDAVREAIDEARGVEEPRAPYSALPPDRFYSALRRATEFRMPVKASADQVLATLRQTPGVKTEEIKDTGLEDWLRAQGDRPITRAEVLEYLRANEVRVEIKRLGGRQAADKRIPRDTRSVADATDNLVRVAGQYDVSDEVEAYLRHEFDEAMGRFTRLPEPVQDAVRIWTDAKSVAAGDLYLSDPETRIPIFHPGKAPNLSLPGAIPGTYVELLAKVPEGPEPGETLAGEAGGGTPIAEGYVEPHFNEPNVVFHVRGAEHLDDQGRRGFLIEEVQSKLQQEARALREKADAATIAKRLSTTADAKRLAILESFPFAKSWHERALKEALDYALRLPPDAQGRRIEWIGWTPGQVQVDRYDLSKQVSEVGWTYSKRYDQFIVTALDMGGRQVISTSVEADGLPGVVGKDVADRITGAAATWKGFGNPTGTLSGLDLKIGGEWAYNLYDRTLPNFVRGYVKKWGAKVEQGHIDARDPKVMARTDTLLGSIETEQPPQPIHQVTITDAMRRAVLEEGQAAFEPTTRYTRRSDATEADDRGAQQAFDFLDQVASRPVSSLRGDVLGRRPTGVPRTLGVAFDVDQINKELRETGAVDFRGRLIASPEAYALAAQILRNPLIETARFHFTNDAGRVVYQESYTSRLPNSATVFATRDKVAEIQAMWERAQAAGATKAWMTHNHPTGDPKASDADLDLTAFVGEHMPLQGHVITDGTTYAFVAPDGTASVRDVPGVTEDLLLRPAVPHRLLRRKIENAEELAALGRELSVPEGSAVAFQVGADQLVRVIQELPIADLVDLDKAVPYLKESRAVSGAVETLLWTTAKDPKLAWNGQFLIRQGAIADYGWTGGTAVVELLGQPGTAAMLEEAAKLRERPGPAIRVEEPTRRYEPLDALDGDLRSVETWVTNAAPRSRIAVGPVVWYRTTNAAFPWRHQAEQISTAGLLARIQAARAAAQAKTLLPAASNADDATRQNTEAVRLDQARARADRRAGVPPVPPITPAPATDAAVEAALSTTAVHGLPAVRDRIVEAYHMARRATTFEYDLRGFPLDRDEIRIFHGARRRALWGAKDDVAGVVGRLANLDELRHLGRIVWLRDWLSRSTLVDTLADGSTTPRYPGGLPFGLTPAQVEPELQRLQAAANARILAAVEAHDRLMEAERVDLEARGLLDEERGIPNYAPHFVLEHQPEPGPRQPGTGQRIREPFRGFLRRTVGSEKAIETNYIRAMFQHRTEVRFADATDDFALTVLQRHDRADRLDPDVRKRLKPGQVVSSLSLVDAQGRPIPGAARYKAIQYRPGRQIFPASSIPERAIAQAIANGEESFEIEVARVRHVGALGRYFRIYVVPEAIATRFEHWGAKETEDGLRLLNNATNRWKALTIGFWGQAGNVLNLLGDVTNLSRTPAALLQLPQAAVEAARWKWGKGTDLTRLMEQYDALAAGYVTGELYFEARMPEFRQFLTHAEQAKQRALDVARTYFRDIPEYREAVPRIAMARHQLRRLAKGKSLQAGPIDITGLTGVRAAMHLSRRFTVDYQWFTPEENRYLRGFLLPFYSWARQNTPNWLRFLWLSKIGLASFLGLRMMLEMWNNGDDDRRTVEQSLQSYERNSAHLVTGWKDKDGKMIVVFWAGDPVADALGMVGLAGTPARLSDLATERITLSQAAREQLRAFAAEPGQRVANLLTPLVKIPGEIIAGKSTLTGGDITPKSMQGTREDFWRRGRHAAESLIRPLREERQFEIASGKKGFDWLTYRYGLGLPFKRIDVEEAEMRVSTDLWYEARAEAVQEALDDARKSVDFAKLAPHQQEVELRDAADKALKAFEKATKRPVTKKRWRELEYAR